MQMNLSIPSRDTASKGSKANDSLSSETSRADDCDCYCESWFSGGGSPKRSAFPRSCRKV